MRLEPKVSSSDGETGSREDAAENAPSLPRKVQSVLFMCAMNAVRSPMAEALAKHFFGKSIYVQSAGARKGEPDGFALAVLDEIGIDLSRHRPKSIEELEEWEGLNFDLIISLSPEAHHKALELTRTHAAEVEYWPTVDPTLFQGSREQKLDAYREVRDGLMRRIKTRLQR
ncbi:Protein-tyrosine-phosphatase OS=Bosea thiooxidans OX=53254 GN=SAMN05660750_01964 PE=4 SV=1 [Bosea thiooxidans]|uniref:Protein-tyrosine-phosphatase n=2 Tax=Bosea thiooxidans TaxID=53254 RepID=A0A1T5DEF3_9HYPH|nr:Protein-tyrosine-phosphatase [Bosea thiooxidans]